MKNYPLFKVHVPSTAISKIQEVLESGFINEGLQVTQLTENLQRVLDAKNIILLNSCTSALTLALKLADVKNGDDVITTPMTCVATNTPIISLGANIVWADIDPTSGMLNPRDVANCITPKTKAIIAVAWAGTPPELDKLRRICASSGIKLILDAAHAFGARYCNVPIHDWADYTCYSFQAIKHFTTGDGGALICNDDNDHKRAKALKWFGLDRDVAKDDKGNWKGQQWDVDIAEAGFKFNMNNIAAALGLAQIEHINDIISRHKENATTYDYLFRNSNYVSKITAPIGAKSVHWVYAMRLLDGCCITRDELLLKLNSEGIMAGVVHVPNDCYAAFDQFKRNLPGVREFSSQQFSLPCGWWLTRNDIQHIFQRVEKLTTP